MGATEKKQPRAGKSMYNTDVNDKHTMGMLYGYAFLGIPLGIFLIPDWGLSTLMTYFTYLMTVATGMVMLYLSVANDVSGISLKMFGIQALSIATRLCCTSWLNGYIPVDSSGDWMIQVIDAVNLLFTVYILYLGHRRLRFSYDDRLDSFPVLGGVCCSLVYAVMTHPSLNGRPLFDTMWTFSLVLECWTACPQIWLMMQSTRPVPSCTTHYVFFHSVSRVFSTIFWVYGFYELSYSKFKWAGECLLFSHFVALVLVADFVYHYLRAMVVQLLAGRSLGGACTQVLV